MSEPFYPTFSGKPLIVPPEVTAWTDVASQWPVTVVSRETEPGHWQTDVVWVEPRKPIWQLHLACAKCSDLPSVYCLARDSMETTYTVTTADLLAGILGHIRRSHPDVVAS